MQRAILLSMFQKCVSQVIYLLTLLITLGLLTNCAAPVTQRPAPQVNPLATIASSATPLMLGNCGRKLVFTKRPERVVTLGLPATELMLKLGLAKAIVGVGVVNNAAPLPELADAYRALPILTKSGGIPKEALLKVNPDLVIDNQPDYFYDAQQGFATVAELKTVDAQVYTLSAKCSGKADATVDDLYTDLWSLGKIFGVGEQAKVTIKEMQERIDSVQAKVKGLPPVTVMYYETGEGPLNIAGPGAWQDVVNLAGGVNAFNDLPESHIQVSVEQVAARDADVFIVAGDTADDLKTPAERLAFLKQTFPNARAVKNNRLIIVPAAYINPGLQNTLGVETLAKLFHPTAFQ